LEKLFVFFLIIAEKCVNITGYGANFNMEQNYDLLSILTSSSSYHYTGSSVPKASGSTTASIIGLKSEKNMYITFQR
jgi:hypothetical protein